MQLTYRRDGEREIIMTNKEMERVILKETYEAEGRKMTEKEVAIRTKRGRGYVTWYRYDFGATGVLVTKYHSKKNLMEKNYFEITSVKYAEDWTKEQMIAGMDKDKNIEFVPWF